jgi:hypothetical protein
MKYFREPNWDRTPWNAGPGELSTDRRDDDEPDYYDDICGECGGEGYVENDCFEDTCCCADPETEHGIRTCPTCKGRG